SCDLRVADLGGADNCNSRRFDTAQGSRAHYRAGHYARAGRARSAGLGEADLSAARRPDGSRQRPRRVSIPGLSRIRLFSTCDCHGVVARNDDAGNVQTKEPAAGARLCRPKRAVSLRQREKIQTLLWPPATTLRPSKGKRVGQRAVWIPDLQHNGLTGVDGLARLPCDYQSAWRVRIVVSLSVLATIHKQVGWCPKVFTHDQKTLTPERGIQDFRWTGRHVCHRNTDARGVNLVASFGSVVISLVAGCVESNRSDAAGWRHPIKRPARS